MVRGMTSTGTDTSQGTVTQGSMSTETVYNYPLTANSSLTTAPMYTTKTETWYKMNTAAAVTSYSVNNTATDANDNHYSSERDKEQDLVL